MRRRVYHVDAANDVWHIDGNHKLIASFIRIPGDKAVKELVCCEEVCCAIDSNVKTAAGCLSISVSTCSRCTLSEASITCILR